MRFQCTHCKSIVSIDDAECGNPVGCGYCGEVTTVPESRFAPGAVVNDFVIRKVIGHGGMGQVYLAHQVSLDRPVALKILMEQFSSDSAFILDFVKEARAAARLNHPNIVQSYAVGEENGVYFFAMEYVEGETLTEVLRREGVLPVEQGLQIVLQIAEALEFAWKHQQLVHRDVKPDNIMITTRGVAKLADLGLARAANELLEDLDEDEVMGTPQYICPEQLLGQAMDTRGDIYSLGATLYQVITGRFPFEGRSAAEIARKHLQEPLTPAHEVSANVPEVVSWMISKMMSKKAEDRYADGGALAHDVGVIMRGESPAGYTGKRAGKLSAKPPRPPTPAPGTTPALPPPLPAAAEVASDDGEEAEVDDPAATGSEGAAAKGKGKRTKLKVGGKRRPSGLSTGAVAPIGGGEGDGGTVVMSGKPRRASQGKRTALLVGGGVATLLLIGIIVLIAKYIGNTGHIPSSASDAEQRYFAADAKRAAEKELYNQIKPYIGELNRHKNDVATLQKVVSLCRSFQTQFPGSLFCRQGANLDYAALYNAPTWPGSVPEGIAKYAKNFAGQVPETLAAYEEQLLRLLRQQRHEGELAEVATRREGLKQTRAWDEVLTRLRSYAKQRHADLERTRNRLQGLLTAREQALTDERQATRKRLFALTTERAFRSAVTDLEGQARDIARYKESVAGEVRQALTEAESDVARRALRSVVKTSDPVEWGKVENELSTLLAEAKIKEVRAEIQGLPAAEEQLMKERESWYTSYGAALAQARRFHELVAGTGRKLEDQRLKLPIKVKDGQQIRVQLITHEALIVKIVELDFKSAATKFQTVGTQEIPLNRLPFPHFLELAKFAWGPDDPAGFEGLLAVYIYFLGGVQQALPLLEKAGGDSATFLTAEAPRAEEAMRAVRLDQALVRIKELAAAKDVPGATKLYQEVKQAYAEDPVFTAAQAELRQLLGLGDGD